MTQWCLIWSRNFVEILKQASTTQATPFSSLFVGVELDFFVNFGNKIRFPVISIKCVVDKYI